MNTQNHTPMPWVGISNDGKFNSANEWHAYHESAELSVFAPIWANGKVIALVVSSSESTNYDKTEHHANAKLIAAAPNLLNMLTLAREALLIWAPKDARLVQIDMAIANATGD